MALTSRAKERWLAFFIISIYNSLVFWVLFSIVYSFGVIFTQDWGWVTDWVAVYIAWGLLYALGWAKYWEDSRNDQ